MSERRFPAMWVDPEGGPRVTTSSTRGERAVVLEYLNHYRTTLEMKLEDLDAQQLARRSVPPSTRSLLGLLRHLARVEHSWCRRVRQGQDLPLLYVTDASPDADFDDAVSTMRSSSRPGVVET